jgi:hypothetical protein
MDFLPGRDTPGSGLEKQVFFWSRRKYCISRPDPMDVRNYRPLVKKYTIDPIGRLKA